MVKHAEQPSLCAKCLAEAHVLAETGRPNDRVLKLCKCAGDDSAVIAVAVKVFGKIIHWHVEGPCSIEQADVISVKIIETLLRGGMRVHDSRAH